MGAHTPTHFPLLSNSGMSTLSRCFIWIFESYTPCNDHKMNDRQSQLITEISSIPTVSSGFLMQNETDFELSLNIRKYSGDCTKKSSYIWRSNEPSSPLTECNSEIKFRSYSPDGNILLIARSYGEKDQFIEIWVDGGYRYVSSINVTKLHGDFLTDGMNPIS